jgi:predicted Zn-dependent protease
MLLLAACSTVPYTNRSRVKLAISKQQEIEIGNKAWDEFRRSNRETNVLSYITALNRVSSNIIAVTKYSGDEWDFMVVDSRTVNAFALPGGKVAVYMGLFKIIDNDAELAMVVAHEMGHVIARHSAERITHNMLQQTVGKGLEVALDAKGISRKTDIVTAYGTLSQLGVNLPYSRTQEYEADTIGLILVTQAGYSPEAAINFFRKLDRISKGQKLWAFFSTHPLTEDRIENLNKDIGKARQRYESAKFHRGLGQIHGPDLSLGRIR